MNFEIGPDEKKPVWRMGKIISATTKRIDRVVCQDLSLKARDSPFGFGPRSNNVRFAFFEFKEGIVLLQGRKIVR